MNPILQPDRFWSRAEVLANPSPVPRQPGVYGWYFKSIPLGIPTANCRSQDGLTLLYTGTAPKAPPQNGRAPSSQLLWDRIRNHYRGNAEGSTLRRTLGCILAEELGIHLRRVGSGKRLTFHTGESKLNEWMAANAFVVWFVRQHPWELECEMIRSVSLPLNLHQNAAHPYHVVLSAVRRAAKEQARGLPIA
jgi:hypothetical protein